MSRNKPPAPAPAVASTGCSSLMSCLSLQRRGAPPALPRGSDAALPRGGGAGADGGKAAEKYWERVQLLEEEIRRLSKWLDHDERPAPAAQTREEEGATAAVTECARNGAKRCAGAGDHGVQDMVRLEDRSYLREVTRVGRPWQRLAVQVSRPVAPVDAASVSEVRASSTSLVNFV